LETLIGRLFYPIGKHDNWQALPDLKGDANTGKGTLCELIGRMFPVGSVGVIGASKEATFGLETLYQQRLVVVPDLPLNFSKVLNQTDFQSMVSGEGVTIPRKNRPAITGQPWRVPMLFAGNFLPDYIDKSGSISRRLVIFLFLNLVSNRDTNLKDKIIKHELVSFMMRCIYKYRRACDENEGKDFWKFVAPESLRDIQSEVKQQTNYLANFLRNGDDYYQIIHKQGETTLLSDLSKAFSNHMKYTHKIDKATIGEDKHPIKDAGYTISDPNLCKICNHHATKENCGDHYNPKNRRKVYVINDMQICILKNYEN
jgi:hypothetical protein